MVYFFIAICSFYKMQERWIVRQDYPSLLHFSNNQKPFFYPELGNSQRSKIHFLYQFAIIIIVLALIRLKAIPSL